MFAAPCDYSIRAEFDIRCVRVTGNDSSEPDTDTRSSRCDSFVVPVSV